MECTGFTLLQAPSESERYQLLHSQLHSCALAPDVSLSTIATQTAALVASDITDLVASSEFASLERGAGMMYTKMTYYLSSSSFAAGAWSCDFFF